MLIEMGVEPSRERVETLVHAIETSIHTRDERIEPPIDVIEPPIDVIEPRVDVIEPRVRLGRERIDPSAEIEQRPEGRRGKESDSCPDGSIHVESERSTGR
ncbi:MAG TPA: hypothetical protein VFM81_04145 [Actinomycetota bacterium]|nr:hypothetical protein [Actinomycetota bacterium]